MSRLVAISVISAGAALCGGLWYSHGKPAQHAKVAVVDPNQDLRAEVERLRADIHNVSAAQRAERSQAQLGAQTAAAEPATATVKPATGAPHVADIERDLADRDRALHESIARVGDRLDDLLSTEVVDSRWRAETVQAVNSVFSELEGKVLSTACGSKLCRVVVEEPTSQALKDLPKQISQKPPFDSDVLYRYDMNANPPKLTMYMTRAGVTMASVLPAEEL